MRLAKRHLQVSKSKKQMRHGVTTKTEGDNNEVSETETQDKKEAVGKPTS